MASNPDCAKLHQGGEPVYPDVFVVGDDGGFANVLVHVVSGLPEGKTYPVPAEPVELTQKDCMYSPHMFVLRPGQPLRVLNPDAIQHNVHLLPKVNPERNLTMNKTRTEMTYKFDKLEGPFKISCDVHGWMEAYCAVLDHPFFAVTEEDGTFTIEGLPAGEYEIEAWHENQHLENQRKTVKVPADGEVEVDFTFTVPKRN